MKSGISISLLFPILHDDLQPRVLSSLHSGNVS
jgi:hypothetical protein